MKNIDLEQGSMQEQGMKMQHIRSIKMKLADFNPSFIKITDVPLNLQENTDNIEEANGLTFDCPRCHKEKVLIWQPKVMWRFCGFGYNDLTIESASSIKIESPCGYRFTIANGEIIPCSLN